MNNTPRFLLFTLLMLATASTASAALLESWQFNETAGTQFGGLVNAAGSATFPNSKPQVATDGAGALAFSQGSSASDNVFRAATLSVPNQSAGIFELEFSILAADLSGGGATGANVGFGMRESDSNADLFLIRLHKQSGSLKLQARTSISNVTLNNFGVDALIASDTPLLVRAVADLTNDLLDVYYTLGTGTEQSVLDIAIPDLEFDEIRLVSNTNSDDWGASDIVTVDYLNISSEVGGSSGDVVLEVNTTNGLMTIKNDTGAALDIDFYEITSTNSLNPSGWNSLQDQDTASFPAGDGSGNGWEELGLANPDADFNIDEIVDEQDLTEWSNDFGANGNSDADGDADTDGADFLAWQRSLGDIALPLDSLLSEGFLTGSSLLANNTPLDLGNGFQIGAAQDLVFKVRLADGTVLTGDVQYITGSALAAVPEPSSLILAVLGLGFVLNGTKRRFHGV